MHRVCLVGAGKIAHMHADALARISGVELVAACDTDGSRAQKLAERHRIPNVFSSLDDALASDTFDFAHVLVPPDRHLSVARQVIDAHVSVLVEKPMGLSTAECDILIRAAETGGVQLGVNHNSVFYPAYLKLRQALVARTFGRLQHLIVVVNHPTSWLNQPGHWKLQHPSNLAYEAAVHPFSQVYDLAGEVIDAETVVSGRHDLGYGAHFYDTWQVSLVCERATAQVLLSHGEYRMYQLVAICQDGVLTAEVEQSRFTALDRTRWGHHHDPLHVATKVAVQEVGSGLANVARVATSGARSSLRSDIYFTSMRDAIAAFHSGPSAQRPNVDGRAGMQAVAMCDMATKNIDAAQSQPPRAPRAHPGARCDLAVLGGTSPIATNLVDLVAGDLSVRVMAHNGRGLAIFDRPGVELFEGEAANPAAVSGAIAGARTVAHIAPTDPSPHESEPSMLAWASGLVDACVRSGVERLVYVGSIDSLYLGNPRATITGATPPDPRARERGDDVWVRSRREELLGRCAGERSLPLCILRPGIVLGAGATPFHRAIGNWRGETHCIGLSDGRNPLPLVLASDVARAIRSALDCEVASTRSYNLVGGVRLSAREYVSELRDALERPLVFHPVRPFQRYGVRACKWLVRAPLRRTRLPFPSYRVVRSLGYFAAFDCSDAEADLGWHPVADRAEFIDQGILVHARARS